MRLGRNVFTFFLFPNRVLLSERATDPQALVWQRLDAKSTHRAYRAAFLGLKVGEGLGGESGIGFQEPILVLLESFEALVSARQGRELSPGGLACFVEDIQHRTQLVQGHGVGGEHCLVFVSLTLDFGERRGPRLGLGVGIAADFLFPFDHGLQASPEPLGATR